MNGQDWMRGVVEVQVEGFFTTHHHFRSGEGMMGTLTLNLGTDGTFAGADGRALSLARTNWWRGWRELREDGVVIGSSRPQDFWKQTTSVGFRGKMYQLEPGGCLTQSMFLVDEAGMQVIEIQPRGFLRQGAYLTLMSPVHPDLVVFTYYLVYARWQEQAAGAAAAGS